MMITAEAVKQLRDKTGVSVMQCKRALEEAGGDEARALEILSKVSAESALKKATRTLGAGTVSSYIHTGGQVGAMVLLSCETDFVSKNEGFVALARDIAMHVAALQPQDTEALLLQPFIKDEHTTVQSLIDAASHKFGERIEISKFIYFSTRG